MAIHPIDLQNMFLRMGQIGKEQAEHRESIAQQQAAQDSSFVKEARHKDQSVAETEDLPDGPNKTEEDEENKSGSQAGGGKQKGKKEQQKKEENEKEFFSDPDLGHHIDITG